MSKQERIDEVVTLLNDTAWQDIDLGNLEYIVRVHPNKDTVTVAKQQIAIIRRFHHANGTVMSLSQADACHAARKNAVGN